jgi:Spy/CpxP family protein refolding chaperone
MRHPRIILAAAALLLTAALGGAAHARDAHDPAGGGPPAWAPPRGGAPHGGGPPPPPPLGPGPRELDQIGLTDAQRDRLADLRDDEMRKVIPLDAEARVAEHDLERMLTADQLDAHAVDELAARVASLRGEMLRARVAMLQGLHDLLTPAQRAKLRRLRAAPDPRGP